MKMPVSHTFHIPVMGTGFTIDTPLFVAKFGISSVISLVDDILIERMRKYYCQKYDKPYTPITSQDSDPRANRITAYLNLLNEIVAGQIADLRSQPFETGTEVTAYFSLLPEASAMKKEYTAMIAENDPSRKKMLQEQLRAKITAGSIDVNIMTKLDRDNYRDNEKLPPEYADALSALRGFSQSTVDASIVFSAGLNKRLYSYIEHFDGFYAQPDGHIRKKIIIKVSDYRSAITQGKFLAKKGLWVSEFRIESGLNCGGHAFPTKGNLLGPVLEEFKKNRQELCLILLNHYQKGLQSKGRELVSAPPPLKITVQGGITTADENRFLLDYYDLDSTGWGTPFLLVPEATSIDNATLQALIDATENDVYMSNVSPLNIIFQNLRTSASEVAKQERNARGVPGTSCPKGYLACNTEFTEKPICTASRTYQSRKIEQLLEQKKSPDILKQELEKITVKSCICHELGGSVLIKHELETPETIHAAICPGPNIAYFNRTYTLAEMVSHIYGRLNLLSHCEHPHMFITELKLYIEALKRIITECMQTFSEKENQHIKSFYDNLMSGIDYYKNLAGKFITMSEPCKEKMVRELGHCKMLIEKLISDTNTVSIVKSTPALS